MLDGWTNCDKGGTTMAAVHGPGGPFMAPCLVWPDNLRRDSAQVSGPNHVDGSRNHLNSLLHGIRKSSGHS